MIIYIFFWNSFVFQFWKQASGVCTFHVVCLSQFQKVCLSYIHVHSHTAVIPVPYQYNSHISRICKTYAHIGIQLSMNESMLRYCLHPGILEMQNKVIEIIIILILHLTQFIILKSLLFILIFNESAGWNTGSEKKRKWFILLLPENVYTWQTVTVT